MMLFLNIYAIGLLVTAITWVIIPEPDGYTMRQRVLGTILGLMFWPALAALMVWFAYKRWAERRKG